MVFRYFCSHAEKRAWRMLSQSFSRQNLHLVNSVLWLNILRVFWWCSILTPGVAAGPWSKPHACRGYLHETLQSRGRKLQDAKDALEHSQRYRVVEYVLLTIISSSFWRSRGLQKPVQPENGSNSTDADAVCGSPKVCKMQDEIDKIHGAFYFFLNLSEAIAAILHQVITQRMELSSADMPLWPGFAKSHCFQNVFDQVWSSLIKCSECCFSFCAEVQPSWWSLECWLSAVTRCLKSEDISSHVPLPCFKIECTICFFLFGENKVAAIQERRQGNYNRKSQETFDWMLTKWFHKESLHAKRRAYLLPKSWRNRSKNRVFCNRPMKINEHQSLMGSKWVVTWRCPRWPGLF